MHPGIFPQFSKNCKKGAGLFRLVRTQCIIKATCFMTAPDCSQIIGSKAENRTCQSADQRNILPGIGNSLQDTPKCTDFFCFQQIRTAAGGTADSSGFQGLLEIAAHGAGTPEQDHNVILLNWPKLITVTNHMVAIQ